MHLRERRLRLGHKECPDCCCGMVPAVRLDETRGLLPLSGRAGLHGFRWILSAATCRSQTTLQLWTPTSAVDSETRFLSGFPQRVAEEENR